MKKERIKIGSLHISISAVMVALCLAIMLGIWYPDIMPELFGLGKILTLFIVTNMIIFPALSVLICKTDKKEQKRDLTILATLQTLIAGAMLYFIYQLHPVWSSLVVDNFEIVRVKDLQPDAQKPSSLAERNIFQPYKIVGASFSSDPKIAEQQKDSDLSGKSLSWYPSALVPLAEKIDTLKKYAQPLEDLKKYNSPEKVAAVLAKYPQATKYFPLRGFVKDGTMLTNKDFSWFQPVDLWPWENDSETKN